MKVIGHAEGGYLIQASQQEIFMLCGHQYLDYKKDEELPPELVAFKKALKDKTLIGQEIPINEMYRAAGYTARRWDEDRSFRESVKLIRAMADEIEEVAKVYSVRVNK